MKARLVRLSYARPSRVSLLFVALVLLPRATPAAEGWLRSLQSGPWSAASTWDSGQVPGENSRVEIRTGHTVSYDVDSTVPIRAVYVSGTLTFAADRDTQLVVGVLKIESGDEPSEHGFDCDAHGNPRAEGTPQAALLVGTPDKPIPARHQALIQLKYFEGHDRQSCPAIVCCGGRMDFHGAPLSRTWVKLGATAAAGESRVALAEPVQGWRDGDQVLVTASRLGRDVGQGSERLETEQRTIQTIEKSDLTLDRPLERTHLGEGEFRAEVANLSRNVIVQSLDPEGVRGHTMYHRDSAGSISYAEFRHLGKRGTLGRYSLHFHVVGDTMRGSSVLGASIHDSHNRWLTIHGTNHLVVRDCVGFRSVGHGFFLEDGTEVDNVLDRNLAVQAMTGRPLPQQVLPFDQNEGAGFWWANSRNTFTRNVTCENYHYGYRFEATETSLLKLTLPVRQSDGSTRAVDIRTLPFVRFDENEAHCDGLYGINLGEGVDRVGPDHRHPFILRNNRVWEIHYAFRPQSPCVLAENLTIHNSIYGVYHPNFDRHVYKNLVISRSDDSGDAEPFNRGHDDDSIQYGMLAVDGLTFAGHRNNSMPLIQISDHNPTGKAESHLRGVRVMDRKDENRRALVNLGGGPRDNPKTPTSVPVYLHDHYGPGRHAKVVSTRSSEVKQAAAGTYRADPPLTGDESAVTEVANVPFPDLLQPVDDLPPTTVITHVLQTPSGWRVRGVASDNGAIRQVLVNDVPARATRPNYAEWEVELARQAVPGDQMLLVAKSVDEVGNQEGVPHRLTEPR